MKKLILSFVLINLSLNGMEKLFQNYKTSVEKAVEDCKNIKNNDKRFEQWQKKISKILCDVLPNSQENLDKLLEIAEKESYKHPVSLFFIHWKKKDLNKPHGLWKLFSWISKKPKNVELTLINKQCEDWVIKAADKYKIVLPYTELANKVSKNCIKVIHTELIYSPIKDEVIPIFRENRIAEITELDLHYLSLLPNKFQESLGYFESLRLNTIPEDVSQLKNLKVLHLINNELTDLPDTLSNLKLLTILALAVNKFTKLPKVINKLQLLEMLVAHQNQLAKDPSDVISKLIKLKHLDLSDNRLASFNSQTLPNSLNSLRLSNNKLHEIDPICALSKLEYVTLENNPLDEEKFLKTIQNLKHLKKAIKPNGELFLPN